MNTTVTVRDVMGRDYVGVSESDSVRAAAELLLEERVESAVVLRGSDPVGMLSSRDALGVLVNGADPAETTVGSVMSEPVPAVETSDPLAAAEEAMLGEATSRLLVREDGEFVGLLTERDLMAASTSRTPEAEDLEEEFPLDREAEAFGTEREGDAFDNQSICEACGSLARDLLNVNGQLLCADCRDV